MSDDILIITVMSFISGTVTAALGFGAGLVLTPLLTFLMPIKQALAVSALVFLVTSASKAYIYRKEIVKRVYVKGLSMSIMGLVVGGFSVSVINPFYLEKFLGLALLYFAVNAIRRKDETKSLIPSFMFPVMGGFMSIMTHAGGAFFFKYCRLNSLDRMQTVGTLAGVHFTLNIMKAIFFTVSGFAASSYIYTLIPAYIASIAGTNLGRYILKNHLDEDLFAKGVGALLIILSFKFLFLTS
ncbi:MAG: hypothetical protein C0603_04555 [Denitrovibrio sp.]|nr:MAG: hypothetical protein C0603_04555 [Denitrovibrio sp.]